MRCEGDPSQACGDAWRILILDFTCKGAPQGGSPMALMSPCSAESYDQDLWNWTSWADLTNPNKGSPLCLQFWPTMCLATEADHEHSRVTVTRNPEKWYYNDTDWTLRVVQPAIPFLNRFAMQVSSQVGLFRALYQRAAFSTPLQLALRQAPSWT